jgi:transcription factor IIIB subunit 2
LKDIFVEGAHFDPSRPPPGGDDKDDELYTLDDKSDGEPMVVIEEEGGGVGMAPGPTVRPDDDALTDADAEADADDIEFAEGSEKGDDLVGWEDAYEQEI